MHCGSGLFLAMLGRACVLMLLLAEASWSVGVGAISSGLALNDRSCTGRWLGRVRFARRSTAAYPSSSSLERPSRAASSSSLSRAFSAASMSASTSPSAGAGLSPGRMYFLLVRV